ncbi:MAG: Co2+/Mg2+ efflux protein ApaG [Polyangia bacterium]|jgi:ApaG protein|nr:Co2+/Mg2+ efflux protein ApaG [Polyangia bacterium]
MSDTTTKGVQVQASSRYVPERSEPAKQEFFFTYEVRIRNLGSGPVKLQARHWIITDAFGNAQHVRGPGVVGAQPRLEPGDSFEYQSSCPLSTPHGSMRGSFRMVTDDGDSFDAEIGSFALSVPEAQN